MPNCQADLFSRFVVKPSWEKKLVGSLIVETGSKLDWEGSKTCKKTDLEKTKMDPCPQS